MEDESMCDWDRKGGKMSNKRRKQGGTLRGQRTKRNYTMDETLYWKMVDDHINNLTNETQKTEYKKMVEEYKTYIAKDDKGENDEFDKEAYMAWEEKMMLPENKRLRFIMYRAKCDIEEVEHQERFANRGEGSGSRSGMRNGTEGSGSGNMRGRGEGSGSGMQGRGRGGARTSIKNNKAKFKAKRK